MFTILDPHLTVIVLDLEYMYIKQKLRIATIFSQLLIDCGRRCDLMVSALDSRPVAWVQALARATVIVPVSPLNCINGYQKYNAGGGTLQWTSIPSGGVEIS